MLVSVIIKNITSLNWNLAHSDLIQGTWQQDPPANQLSAMNYVQWTVSGTNGNAAAAVRYNSASGAQEFIEFAFTFRWGDIHNNSLSSGSNMNIPGYELYSDKISDNDKLTFTLVIVPKI